MSILAIEQECFRSYEPDWMDVCPSGVDEMIWTYLYGLLTHI